MPGRAAAARDVSNQHMSSSLCGVVCCTPCRSRLVYSSTPAYCAAPWASEKTLPLHHPLQLLCVRASRRHRQWLVTLFFLEGGAQGAQVYNPLCSLHMGAGGLLAAGLLAVAVVCFWRLWPPLCVPDLGQLSTIAGAAMCRCFGWFCCLFLHRRHAMELPTRVVGACLRRYAAEMCACRPLCLCPAATLLPGRVCGWDCSSCTFRTPLNVLLPEVRSAILCFLRPCTCTTHARVGYSVCYGLCGLCPSASVGR